MNERSLNPAIASVALTKRDVYSAYYEMTKPGITLMVVVSTAAGFWLALPQNYPAFEFVMLFIATVIGTALVSAGSCVLNHVMEHRYDLENIGTEIHKAFLHPLFNEAPEEACTHARGRIGRTLGVVAAHLEGRSYLVGERFTVADAYLVWALVLVRSLGIELAPSLSAYARRLTQRPSVRDALACESAMLEAGR